MSRETIKLLSKRLKEHLDNIPNGNLMIVAHGGEPLLYPDLDFFFAEIKSQVKRVVFAIQTNGVLLNEGNIHVLKKHSVRIGLSVDGDRESHNRSRITHAGTGSYDLVLKGIKSAKMYASDLFDSVLQVIDPTVDPKKILDTLESFDVERADFLLPDLNHDTILDSSISPGDCGRWLIEVFDLWVSRANTINIRTFLTIIDLLLGGKSGSDQLGAHSMGALMIETDGSYLIHDGLKTAYSGAGMTGMNVKDNSVSQAEELPLAKAFQDKASGAAIECLNCRLFSVCGGGSPIHRYSKENDYDRPSIFCEDLTLLIDHIQYYLKSVDHNLNLVVN